MDGYRRINRYGAANLLIQVFGTEAADFAWQKMNELRQKDDVKGAAVWLSVGAAIDDLQHAKQEKLH